MMAVFTCPSTSDTPTTVRGSVIAYDPGILVYENRVMHTAKKRPAYGPIAVTLVILGLVASVRADAAPDPYTGTWTLDAAKSGGVARSQVLTIAVTDNQETYQSDLELWNGQHQVTTYTAAYDGKEYPCRTVTTEADGTTTKRDGTVVLLKIDARTRERLWKQRGRVVRILRRVVSPDGKTLRSQVIEVNAKGEERATVTLVFHQ